ncbi:MAG: glycosyltransferase [Clostridium sp.]
MKKINVCHVVSGLKSGGAESMIYNYVSKMEEDKYEFSLLYQHEPVEKCINEFNSLNFKLKRISSKIKNPIKNYRETKKFLIKNKVDVIHCHMTLGNCIPLIAAKRAKVKLRICHAHETGTSTRGILDKIVEKIYKKICLLCANKYIACGNVAGRFLYGNNEFIILNNALDLEKFRYNEEIRKKIREEMKISEECMLIGHVGRFIGVKNHRFIVEFFKEVVNLKSNFKLILVGSGELENEIKQLVKNIGIEKNIIFTGVVENVHDYYNAFDIFILPSKREGLPLVALESQANGLKCYLSEGIDKNTCVIDSCRMIALEKDKWINEIINTKVEYKRNISLNKFNQKNMNIDEEVKKLNEIYGEVLNGE